MKSLDLIASENILSPLARTLQMSRYSEQYYLSNARYSNPSDSPYPYDSFWPAILEEGNQLLAELFGAAWADPRPLSGTHAMNCLLAGLLSPGDKIVVSPEKIGGHFATEYMAKRLGLIVYYNEYDPRNYTIDIEKSARLIKKVRPKVVTLDISHQLFPHPVAELRKLCGDDILITFDASHTLGLIAGGQLQKPLAEGADLLHGSTHKTFPGPQKALFVGNSKPLQQMIDSVLFPKFSSNYHLHHVLALFAATLEMKLFGADFAQQVVSNAQTLAKSLAKLGLPVMASERGYTQSHQVWLNLPGEYVVRLNHCGIRLTAFLLPGVSDPQLGGPPKGVRMGLASLTRQGMVEKDMGQVAQFVADGVRGAAPLRLQQSIHDYVSAFKGMKYSFESMFQIETKGGKLGRLLAELLRQENLEPVFDHLVNQYRDSVVPIPLFLFSKKSSSRA